jgi:predicted nucleotidyltransferase
MENISSPQSKEIPMKNEGREYKNGLGDISFRNLEQGRIEADKRREYVQEISKEVKRLLYDIYGTTDFGLRPCGSVVSNLCTPSSDIDFELFLPKNHQTVDIIAFNKELNERLKIPYRAEMHIWYLDNPSYRS